ncbi:caveolin-2-like [Xyrichtys novacula]|uniref:Caveolin n=1 Tax=Xyrichtys novacula TaxID=13765 RepID=A0AAV1F2J3_XYRNO|nr:caveolin-2-like [Xyrichtys novacula]
MMMVSDDCLVECKIDDDSEEEEMKIPPPPPEFASKTSTPGPKPPTPPTAPTTPTPTPKSTPTPSPTPIPTPPQPVNRDPYGINQHLKVDVNKVLVEPTSPHGQDKVWVYSTAGFEKTRICTYRCLTLLLAVPFALLCGVVLAVLACLHVWVLVPCIQLSQTFLPCLRSLCFCAVDVILSPFCTSLALCCSQINILLSKKDWRPMKDKEAV